MLLVRVIPLLVAATLTFDTDNKGLGARVAGAKATKPPGQPPAQVISLMPATAVSSLTHCLLNAKPAKTPLLGPRNCTSE